MVLKFLGHSKYTGFLKYSQNWSTIHPVNVYRNSVSAKLTFTTMDPCFETQNFIGILSENKLFEQNLRLAYLHFDSIKVAAFNI